MNEHEDGRSDRPVGPEAANPTPPKEGQAADARPSLTTQVRRRRADHQFFLRLRDAIQQNHKALERLGT